MRVTSSAPVLERACMVAKHGQRLVKQYVV